MNVLVIDGQGGGLGRQLVAAISAACPEARLTAVGTNSLATSAMLKAGTVRAATGENAVVVNCRTADVIVGPIGIVIADALLGEITPAMAAAVCQSPARRVLVPINHCENIVVGVPDQPIGQLVAAAAQPEQRRFGMRGRCQRQEQPATQPATRAAVKAPWRFVSASATGGSCRRKAWR